MIARPLLWQVAVGTLLLAPAIGCGTDSEAPAPGQSPPPTTEATGGEKAVSRARECQLVARTPDGVLRLCFRPNRDEHGTFVVGEGSAPRSLEVEPPGPTPSASDAGRAGHWSWAALSPDGSTLLAEWSAECEVPIAFLIPLSNGLPRPVTGESDWARSPESLALGWTTDGRAIVFLPHGLACGSGSEAPGVYLYAEPGVGKLIVERRGVRSPVGRSRRPRSVSALVSAGS